MRIGFGIIALVFVGCGLSFGWKAATIAFALVGAMIALITLAVWFIVRGLEARR